MVTVPGVRVMELATRTRATSSWSPVRKTMSWGRMGMRGERIRRATSTLAVMTFQKSHPR
jgi:hypothetical protein